MLITPDMITKFITSIGKMLEVKWPKCKVAVSRFVEIYATPAFRFTISDRNIFATINISITLHESLFDAYPVITMPIATSSDTSVGLSKIANTVLSGIIGQIYYTAAALS